MTLRDPRTGGARISSARARELLQSPRWKIATWRLEEQAAGIDPIGYLAIDVYGEHELRSTRLPELLVLV
ncbi:MAG: hypothetical protein ABII76_17220, partial [Pseudomonadota bacterium]